MSIHLPSSSTYVEPLERQRGALRVLAVGLPDGVREGIDRELADRVATVEMHDTSTAEDALARVDSGDVDCVVSSDDLPNGDPLALLEDVKARDDSVAFVLLPEAGSERLASAAVNAGADGYFPAGTNLPNQYAAIAERIESVVDVERTRTALAETTRLLLRLTEYTTDTLWMFSDDWRETAVVNAAYEDVWDRSMVDLIDDPEDFLEVVHPDDVEGVLERMGKISAGEPMDFEHRITTGDGVRWMSVHAEPVFDEADEIEYVAGFTRDITELKNRELSMQSLHGATAELLSARDENAVARIVIDIVNDVVGSRLSAVHVPSDDGTELRPLETSDEVLDAPGLGADDVAVLSTGDAAYEVFQDGEIVELSGDEAIDTLEIPRGTVESLLVVPLGEHALLTVGIGPESSLTTFERELVGILARTATAALARVE